MNFDPSRIKITVTTPVVRIKRLSKDEIAKMLQIPLKDVTSRNRSKTNDLSNHTEKEIIDSKSTSGTMRMETAQPAKRVKFSSSTKCSEIRKETNSQSTSDAIRRETEQAAIGVKLNSTPGTNTLAIIEFKENEVIWAKLKGHPHWPAKIVGYENKKFEIFWFNDYRRSKVFRSQIFKFNQSNFETFSKTKKIGFEAAVKEAILYGKALSST